jgi:hypothetical protein
MKITLDTNCFFEYYERDSALIQEIVDFQEKGYIEIAMTTRVMVDTLDKWKGKGISPIWEKIQSFPILEVVGTAFRLDMSRLDSEDYLLSDDDVSLMDKLRLIMPEAQNEDLDHIFGHMKANRDIFVSNDNHFLNHRDQLNREFRVEVLSPKDTVQQIKKLHK